MVEKSEINNQVGSKAPRSLFEAIK